MTTSTQQIPPNPALDFANSILEVTNNGLELIEILRDIANDCDEKATTNDRIAAANILTDRAFGKCPKQVGGATSGVLAQPAHQHVAGSAIARVIACRYSPAPDRRSRKVQVTTTCQQLPAHPVQLANWPPKLRRKVPRVDGALTCRPGCGPSLGAQRIGVVNAVRKRPASTLSPVLARPGALPESPRLVTQIDDAGWLLHLLGAPFLGSVC